MNMETFPGLLIKVRGIKGMKHFYTCPRCGFRFEISYARSMACIGCNYASLGNCNLVKCPKCGFEFEKSRGLGTNSVSQIKSMF